MNPSPHRNNSLECPTGSAPVRVQRKRAKGWRMPANTVYVGRGSLWGNPYSVAEYGRKQAVDAYRAMYAGRHCLKLRRDLRGKNLACWCSLDVYCHADVLLEIANAEPAPARSRMGGAHG